MSDDSGANPGVHLSHRQIILIFIGLMLGMLLAALDQTIVSAALPTIVGELGGLNELTWVVTSYLLTSTVTILLWGKLSDIYGRKIMFQISIGTFLAASALIGLSPNMTFLILGRGLQGIGAGGIMSLAFAIIGDILSPRERGKYMGFMGSVFLLSSVVGPFLGGFIVDHFSWRWIFYVNLPIGIPALFVIGVVLRLPVTRQNHSIDYLGAALVTVAASMLILACMWGGQPAPWDSSYNLRWFPDAGDSSNVAGMQPDGAAAFLSDWLVDILLGAALVMGAVFLWVESHIKYPILPVSLFRDRTFTIASSVSFIIGAAMFGGFVFLPTYLQISTGTSATRSGFLLLPMIAGLMPMSTLSGILISKTGRYKWWPLVGLPVASAGMLMLSQLSADTSQLYLAAGMFLLGAGIGMVMQVMVLAVQNSLPMNMMGTGTAANNFLRSLGSVIGVSIFGAIFSAQLKQTMKEVLAVAAKNGIPPAEVANSLRASPEVIHTYPDAIRIPITEGVATGVGHVFLYALPALLVGFVLVWFLKEVPLRSTRHVGAAAMEGGEVLLAAEETAPVTPAPPLLRGATPPDRRVGIEPADQRAYAPRPASAPAPGRPPVPGRDATRVAPRTGASGYGSPRDNAASKPVRLPSRELEWQARLKQIHDFVDSLPSSRRR
ncbi:MAG: MDR family MFS transporter [Candidatus Thermoplasmatota archaeon]